MFCESQWSIIKADLYDVTRQQFSDEPPERPCNNHKTQQLSYFLLDYFFPHCFVLYSRSRAVRPVGRLVRLHGGSRVV